MTLHFEPFYQDYLNTLAAYNLAITTMYTDQVTCAPKKGIPNSNLAISVLSKEAFQIENNPKTIQKIKEYFLRLEDGSLEKMEVAMRLEQLADTENIPSEVFEDYVKTKSDAGYYWHQAKETNDYALFKPYLKDVMEKTIKLMQYSPKYKEGAVYDLLLDQFEKGMNEEKYDAFFHCIKEELVPFIHEIQTQGKHIDDSKLSENFDIARQEQFMEVIMDYLQVDRQRVYLTTTEHPFTNFLSHDDIRITTHFYPDRFLSAILSTVHEYGHALYGLQMDKQFENTELNLLVGSGAHESQSRLLENHIGRSKAFWKANYTDLVRLFPEFKEIDLDDLVDMINVSKPNCIRTEADELTYPLHILIRYEIEKQIANQTIDYDTLPQVWADKYEQYLGVRPKTDSEGVLQDIHWSDGALGYFPTYALGSAYAAQIYATMEKEIDVEEALLSHHFEIISDWLEKNVHHYAASKTMAEIVELVSKEPFNPQYYIQYLKTKFSKVYGL